MLHNFSKLLWFLNISFVQSFTGRERIERFVTLNKMDIAYMKTSNGFTNDSDFVHSDFIEQNLGIAIPYLIIISLCTLIGCIGNIT